MQMANQYLQSGRIDQAEALYRQILAAEPANAAVCSALGKIYYSQEKHEQAIRYLEKAVELDPDNIPSRMKLGDSLRNHGFLEQAKHQYRLVLKLQPGHAEALVVLALISHNHEYTEDIRLLEKLYARPQLPRHIRRRLAFTLGKIFDDLQDYERAFDYLAEGNRIAHEDHPATIEATARSYRQIRTIFDADFFRRHKDTGIADDSIILITGMPRSGSSLVEQIMASHPDIYGAGEILCIQQIIRKTGRMLGTRFPAGFGALGTHRLQNMARHYVAELKKQATCERYISDKNMGTIVYLGLLCVMLPNAKIIHCIRDPRDQGLSFFQQDFLQLQPNSYDLIDIARYYLIRQALMDHWYRLLPGRIYPVHYEDLVADLETHTRKLLDHCGLPFEPACLAFHETERTVNTASLAQVRRPLYTSSAGRWKNYTRQLQPLISALGMQ